MDRLGIAARLKNEEGDDTVSGREDHEGDQLPGGGLPG